MNKLYVVGQTCGSRNGAEVAPYFVVGISYEDAVRALAWMDKFAPGGALHDAAFVHFWDAACVFLDGSCVVLSSEQCDELLMSMTVEPLHVLTKEELACDPDELTSEDQGYVRTEGDVNIVWSCGMNFQGWVSESDDMVETNTIPRALIEDIARRTAPATNVGEVA